MAPIDSIDNHKLFSSLFFSDIAAQFIVSVQIEAKNTDFQPGTYIVS